MLKVKGLKQVAKVHHSAKAQEILDQVKSYKEEVNDGVVYGVYNNSNASLWVRMEDFFIDREKVSLKTKSYFFHMLAVMVDSGIPIVTAIKSLASRAGSRKFQRVLNTIVHSCEGGKSVADAMGRFDDVFDQFEIGIVKSGEATGRLDKMLLKLSKTLDARSDLHMKLWAAAIYPIVVFTVLLLVSIGMLVYVLPTLLELLAESGVARESLPLSTKFLIVVQSGIVNFWWLILLVLASAYGLFNFYKQTEYGALRWDFFKLKLPFAGSLLRKVYTLRFVSMLGILIDAGVPVITTLKITGNALSNRVYRLKMQEVIAAVRRGEKISESIKDSSYLFSSEVVQMLRIGERSAALAQVSEKVAKQYDREIANSLKKLSSVFEPAMILFVGLFVGLLALAIMAPMFNLSAAVGNF
ncbi:type II secretion system F family protein [Candidatus Gracilibacteria bacterium]|nr:type II secretion system F family protein [Candidatus Gracilibacteria bacterium]